MVRVFRKVFSTVASSAQPEPNVKLPPSCTVAAHFDWTSSVVGLAGVPPVSAVSAAVLRARHSDLAILGEPVGEVASLTVYQRTANWCTPLNNRPITPEEQARLRAERMWNWSNSAQGLFLQTSNMSEKFAGYTTVGGDLEGAFSVIANLPKTVVIALLVVLPASLTTWRPVEPAPLRRTRRQEVPARSRRKCSSSATTSRTTPPQSHDAAAAGALSAEAGATTGKNFLNLAEIVAESG